MPMILAGDVGGTSTRLGLFDPLPARPKPIAVHVFSTSQFESLSAMVASFIERFVPRGESVDAGAFGVAGPVVGDSAKLTNVSWTIEAHPIASMFGWSRVRLLNDLQAMAYAVPVLNPSEVRVLQEGVALRGGNMALIAAGTGLGEALLHNMSDRFIPSATEGGHADYAPRNDREVALMRNLTSRFGRAEVEHVLSGRGFGNIHRVTHTGPCAAGIDPSQPDAPAAISAAGLARTCPAC